MPKTSVSSKGQIVIPKDVRERHGWTPGTTLEIEDQSDAVVLRSMPAFSRTTLDDLVGCTGYRGRRKSLKDMEAAIVEGARRSR